MGQIALRPRADHLLNIFVVLLHSDHNQPQTRTRSVKGGQKLKQMVRARGIDQDERHA